MCDAPRERAASSKRPRFSAPRRSPPTRAVSVGIFWQRGVVVEVTALDPQIAHVQHVEHVEHESIFVNPVPELLEELAIDQFRRFRTTAFDAITAEQELANERAKAAGCPGSPTKTVHKTRWSAPPKLTINVNASYTTRSAPTWAPLRSHWSRRVRPRLIFPVFLAQRYFFSCNTFDRVIPGFVDQTGDPSGTGSGGPGTPSLTSSLRHRWMLRTSIPWGRSSWRTQARRTPGGASGSWWPEHRGSHFLQDIPFSGR